MKKAKTIKLLSRSNFIRSTIGAAGFMIIPRHVLGGPGYTPPSEKLNIAVIGAGGRGRSHLKEFKDQNIVALCDVDRRNLKKASKDLPKVKKYSDFRKMLDKEKSIDAVSVAIPDHVHAAASMAVMKRGKHLYCEKPLTHSVYEAKMVAEAAQKYKVATQMGNQGQASEETRLKCEYIWDGAIGPVREVHLWTRKPLKGLNYVYWPQGISRPAETHSVPSYLDWDLWLGPAPERPYNRCYMPFKWRGWLDFGTGVLGDIGCHAMDSVFRALKLGHPESVEAVSTRLNKETYPAASIIHYKFPKRPGFPPLKLSWYDGGLRPPRPDELEDSRVMGDSGVLFVGDKGKMLGNRLIPESKMTEYKKPEKTIPRSIGHFEEWINACKGGVPAGSNFDHAGLLTQVVLLGNIALRLEVNEKMNGARLEWDGDKMEFTNCDKANQFLHRKYRDGWSL